MQIGSIAKPAARREPQATRRKAFIPGQIIPEAVEFRSSDENGSHVAAQSEKRDVVGTGRIEAAGKIACNAVDAEYRCRRVGTSRHRNLKKNCYLISDDRSFIKAWIDEFEEFGTNS